MAEDNVKTISRENLKAKIDGGEEFVLLEVLPEESYRSGHLPGAIQFQDMGRVDEVIPDKGTEVIAYCSNFT